MMMMRLIKFYLIFLIYLFSHQLGFAHEITTVCQPPNLPISSDIHYVAIIDHAAGSFISTAHDFLFQQLYCSLNDAKNARVKFDSWHIDSDLGECKIYDSNNSITNIHGKIFESLDVIPPSQTRSTLCEKLEI
uniref:Uncharacterized protein n=1 Tax=Panagrolaimus sp. ES5 TaxID=591445 RepID=A0AC34GC43_9BILA